MSNTINTLSPVQCKPWCEDSDGHPNRPSIEDQGCMTESRFIPLSQETPILDGDGLLMMQSLEAYVYQVPGKAPCVSLSQESFSDVSLTLSEAEGLRDALTALLG